MGRVELDAVFKRLTQGWRYMARLLEFVGLAMFRLRDEIVLKMAAFGGHRRAWLLHPRAVRNEKTRSVFTCGRTSRLRLSSDSPDSGLSVNNFFEMPSAWRACITGAPATRKQLPAIGAFAV